MINTNREKGVALVIVISIAGILMMFGLLLLRSGTIQYQQSEQSKGKERALFYADAGIEEARWYILEKGANWLNGIDSTVNGQFHTGFAHAIDSTQGYVSVAVQNITDIAGQDLYTISSVGTYTQGSKTFQRKIVATAAAVSQSSMSDIFLFIGDDNQNVGNSYNVFGPLHVNGNITFIDKGALFHNKLTVTEKFKNSSGTVITAGSGGQVVSQGWGVFDDINPVGGGVDIPPLDGQARITPIANDFNQSRYKAISGGIHSAGNLIVDFYEEDSPGFGGYVILNSDPSKKYYLNELSQKTIYSDADIYVKGTLQGQITVAATNNVYIQGNILYSPLAPPLNEPHIMGLMAKNNIIIPQTINSTLDFINAQGQGTPSAPLPDGTTGDLIISAALYAGNQVYFALNMSTPKKGSLVINGSMASKLCVYFKMTSGTDYWGFKQRFYNYDNNFTLFSPPNYISYSPPCIWNWHEEGV
jgi:Tfp pilus assembly protein PilX